MDEKNRSRHHGLYIRLWEQSEAQLLRSILSYRKNVAEHRDKIKKPAAYVADWAERSIAYKQSLIRKWLKDVRRNSEQLAVARTVADERGIPHE